MIQLPTGQGRVKCNSVKQTVKQFSFAVVGFKKGSHRKEKLLDFEYASARSVLGFGHIYNEQI